MSITQDQLKTLFDYRDDGNLTRRVAISGPSGKVGMVVGSFLGDTTRPGKGYMATKISGKHYCIHRLIWMWHHGDMPEQIDHINRNSLDNRIENLRPATASQNTMNRKLFANSTSGCRGVSWHKKRGMWWSYVDVNKKRKSLGYFNDLELADLVAVEARSKFHGQFANAI
jgi:hypothetical protein